MKQFDGWLATTSDGREHHEQWIAGAESPWTSLMRYCKDHKEYVIYLKLSLGDKYIMLPANQQGYWQAHAVSGSTTGHESLARGVGYVTANIVRIAWGTYNLQGNPVFWEEQRLPTDQQIIWSAGV